MTYLRWKAGRARDTFVASCGSEDQGEVLVWLSGGTWRWKVDMLPGDAEPAIRATRGFTTAQEAMAMAEAQVTLWPTLVRDAAR